MCDYGRLGHMDTDRPEVRNPNPMNSRCGLADCDCGYMIEQLDGALRRLQDRFNELWREQCANTVHGPDCPCYQAGYEAERRPVGA